ncbi:hypothetical protein TQ38_028725 (plasmid) [Novosphingobium sp. P6W]|nr:hypothetical protein TQ38_028725 [Novosphingobium sp. P6W]
MQVPDQRADIKREAIIVWMWAARMTGRGVGKEHRTAVKFERRVPSSGHLRTRPSQLLLFLRRGVGLERYFRYRNTSCGADESLQPSLDSFRDPQL